MYAYEKEFCDEGEDPCYRFLSRLFKIIGEFVDHLTFQLLRRVGPFLCCLFHGKGHV